MGGVNAHRYAGGTGDTPELVEARAPGTYRGGFFTAGAPDMLGWELFLAGGSSDVDSVLTGAKGACCMPVGLLEGKLGFTPIKVLGSPTPLMSLRGSLLCPMEGSYKGVFSDSPLTEAVGWLLNPAPPVDFSLG